MFNKLQPATQWGWNEVFNNRMVHLLETIVWQNATPQEKGKRARHMALKPELYRPEWLPKANDGGIKKDTVAAPVDDIKALLARPRK